jgi:predicted RNA-binding protein with PIN domain
MAAATQDIAEQQYIGSLSNPLEVAQAMMQDLHNASATVAQQTTRSNTTEAVSPTADTYSLDVNHWASLSFVYQVT